ncbi:MAG: hypothetical protein HYT90_02095 [Candidatus Omnitrophica bacterium]|nr:hypothetical protein [Candidatus Omnitrophota bacterium]
MHTGIRYRSKLPVNWPVSDTGTAAGFTLVETMVAGTLLVSLSLVAALWLAGVSDLWWTATTQGEVRRAAQQAMNRMVDELRSATRTAIGSPPNASIPAAPGNTAATFYLPADEDGNGLIIDAVGNTEWDTPNPVQYAYVPAQRQLVRIQGGQQRILANDIAAISFEDALLNPALYQNEMKITLTMQRTTPQRRTVSATAVEIVKLRN